MTSWRDVLRQRQLAFDAADQEELETKKKCASPSEESIDSGNSYHDVAERPGFSFPHTADAATWLIETDMQGSESLTSDNLPDGYARNTSPAQERPATFSNDVENTCIDHGQMASDGVYATEITHQSSPASDDLGVDVKFDADGAADVESLHSVDFIESDHISSSCVDSSMSHYQLSESLSSTPEHLISAKGSSSIHALDCTSDGSEAHVADEVPQPIAESAISLDIADVQSPEHKRTRRHAQKHGTHTRRKQRRAVEKVEADNVEDQQQELGTEFNDYSSKPSSVHSDIHSTSQPEQSELNAFQSYHSDETRHVEVVPDAVATDDLAVQLLRQASYLKAVGIGSKNTVTPWQPRESTVVAESTAELASKDHSSSRETTKTDGN